jgi:sortase (surface protein transpeptidase)
MRTLALLTAVPAILVASFTVGGRGSESVTAVEEFAPPGIGEQLRYIGRDLATGAPVTVDDRFIAEVERAVERYGKDEVPAEAAPPVDGPDVKAVAIPALNVDAVVARYGTDNFGRLEVPQDTYRIGWNPAYASLPGSGRATFFAAHFEYGGVPGVFFRLSTLSAGQEVLVTLTDGSVHRYRVTSTIDYALGDIDMGALLAGREGVESITLMTCSGPIKDGNYELRTVVLAERMTE